jgi:GPH family glycoside/pentoside/hexuronide:cation symporter
MSLDEIEVRHSKKNMLSYGSGKFISEFFNMCFGAYVFYYYEGEVGLETWLVMVGYIIFAIWNAFNDPLVGYLTDRPFKFTKKWGRRFPWVLIGGIPWILSYYLIFTPPIGANQLVIFAWLIIMTCIYDTFASVYGVNFYAIFPDKFRGESERRLASAISTPVAAAGTALGFVIPSQLIEYGFPSTFIVQAGAVVITCMIALMLAIPGSREDQVRIDCYLEKCEEGMEHESFFKEYKLSLKHKNWLAYILSFMFYTALTQCMIGSINFVGRYVLDVEAGDTTIIFVGLFLGMLLAMPLWAKIADKTNNDRRTYIIAGFCMTAATGPLFFITDFYIMIFGIFIWGFCQGGFWVMMDPVKSNTIDESVVMSNRRKEGIYQGIQTFASKFALVIQAITFASVHILTGFVEGGELIDQPASAIIGVRMHFALIPMIYMLIGALILWKNYTLTQDQVKINKEKIKEMRF